MVTITAPIRLPAKTADALEDDIRARLASPSRQVQSKDTIHGNQIRVRLVKRASTPASKVIGFVHNPDTDPDVLLDFAQSLLRQIGTAAESRAPAGSASERWLVVVIEGGFWPVETYRQIYGQLCVSTDFMKILMVFADGRVEILAR
jgi:hypothetical protein